MYSCPECDQPINPASEVCPYCGADLTHADLGTAEVSSKRRPAKIVILWAVVLLSLLSVAWLALPWRLGGSKAEAEAHGTAAVAQLQQALATYQASERSFPTSLETLGSAAQDASREAQSGRYTVQYLPGKPQSDGRIVSYTLTARAGNYAYLNLFADETGQIHGTRENRPASAQDPVIETDRPKNP
jgi:type II secretory pathway pseudopilin PulG